MARLSEWLAEEFGAHLTEWERGKIGAAEFGYICLLCEATGTPLLPLYVNPDNPNEDEFGLRDGIDGMIFSTGEGTREEYESGLWALERMGLAKQGEDHRWNLTPAGRDAAVALEAYARLLKVDESEAKPKLFVIPGGPPEDEG